MNIRVSLKYVYIFLLVSLSFYYFSTGLKKYNIHLSQINYDYSPSVKIEDEFKSVITKNNLKDNIKNSKIINFPRKITEFSEKINRKDQEFEKSVSNEKDKKNHIQFENTQVAKLIKKMDSSNYDLDKVSFTKEIPDFFIESLPNDISFIKDTKSRKKIFISIALPLIVESNRDILLVRGRLEHIYEKLNISKTLTINEHSWLVNLAVKHSVPIKNEHKISITKNLLEHIDIIPNSIALAQAAKESGWGTSRFARDGNALFGQWTYDDNSGLLPLGREEGEKHLIKSFPSLRESVKSYMRNINSHRAYSSFRKTRSEFRENNMKMNYFKLVDGLKPYAESPNYTDIIKKIIETNKLYLYDDVTLINKGSLV